MAFRRARLAKARPIVEFGDEVAADHLVDRREVEEVAERLETEGFFGLEEQDTCGDVDVEDKDFVFQALARCAMGMMDRATKFRMLYPQRERTAERVVLSFLHFRGRLKR